MLKLLFKFSIGSWLSAAISLFTTPIVTALILPEDFGKASMYTLAFNFLLQLSLLGTDQSFVRKFYQNPVNIYQSKLLVNSISAPLILSFAIAALILAWGEPLSIWLVDDYSREFLAVLSLTLIISVFERYAMLILRMKKQALAFSILRTLLSVINFLVIFGYAHLIRKDFYAIIYGNFISLVVCTFIAIWMTRKQWKISSVETSLVKEILKYGFPFLPTFVVLWVFEGMDKMALRQYSGFYEIGLFSAAYKIVAVLSILQTAFSIFWAPVSFEMYEKSSDTAKQVFSKVFAYISAVLFICGVGMILFKDVLILLFDKSYHEASSIMPFLLLVPIMYTLSEVTVGGINYKNRTYWHLAIAAIAAGANYGLNVLLVPEYGAKGAAISTGLAYLIFFYTRTYISNLLFPIQINYVKLHFGTFLFIAVCFINSFYPKEPFSYVITGLSIFMIMFLYRSELHIFKMALMKNLRAKPFAVANESLTDHF